MSLNDEPAPLSPWPFLIADALVVSTALIVGLQNHAPYSNAVVMSIGALMATGAALTVLPFVINHARKQDLLLAERQREIAALAQTVSACTEQLSIAAGSLHSIAENAAKSVKQAEQLPGKLQEKIHEFKERLNEVSSTENEALTQEVNALRSAETERIETVVTTVRKLSGEFARLEAASRKNVTELSDSLSRFTTSAEQAAVETTTSLAALRADAAKSLASAEATAVSAIETAIQQALDELDGKLALFSGQLTTKINHAATILDGQRLPPEGRDSTSAQRTDQPVIKAAPINAGVEPSVETNDPEISSSRAGSPSGPVNTAAIDREAPTAVTNSALSLDGKGSRKKPAAPKNIAAENEFSLGLDLPDAAGVDDFDQVGLDAAHRFAVSHDGLTRLLVTAYIGIGNKLFARGEGPGLNWQQGVPLQFVSIGKWRWETAEAELPVKIKLYKNDDVECSALGELQLSSGQQLEVTASF